MNILKHDSPIQSLTPKSESEIVIEEMHVYQDSESLEEDKTKCHDIVLTNKIKPSEAAVIEYSEKMQRPIIRKYGCSNRKKKGQFKIKKEFKECAGKQIIHKFKAPKQKSYSKDDVFAALLEIQEGKLGYLAASKKYGVPKTTLVDKFNGKYKQGKDTPGPETILNKEEELRIANWFANMTRIEYGKAKKELPMIVKHVLDNSSHQRPHWAKNVFVDNKPSEGWIYRFMSRHKDALTARTDECSDILRANADEKSIKKWFDNFKEYLLEEHDSDAVAFLCEKNRSRIFSCNETGFPLAEGRDEKTAVLAPKDEENFYMDTLGQITVLGCVSADGSFMKPFVTYPPNQKLLVNFKGARENFILRHSDKGCMTGDCFFEYIAHNFYPAVKDKVKFPIILFLDGLSSHINLPLFEFCKAHNIILYCFPAHVIQPLDVSVCEPLIDCWNNSLNNYEDEHPDTTITAAHFLHVFSRAWDIAKSQELVEAGFRNCGLVPFEQNNVKYSCAASVNKNQTSERKIRREAVGIRLSLNVFEEYLTAEQLRDFQSGEQESDSSKNEYYQQLKAIYLKLSSLVQRNNYYSESQQQPASGYRIQGLDLGVKNEAMNALNSRNAADNVPSTSNDIVSLIGSDHCEPQTSAESKARQELNSSVLGVYQSLEYLLRQEPNFKFS